MEQQIYNLLKMFELGIFSIDQTHKLIVDTKENPEIYIKKEVGELNKNAGLTLKLKHYLVNPGDFMLLENEVERRAIYLRARNLNMKVSTRKLKDGNIYVFLKERRNIIESKMNTITHKKSIDPESLSGRMRDKLNGINTSMIIDESDKKGIYTLAKQIGIKVSTQTLDNGFAMVIRTE